MELRTGVEAQQKVTVLLKEMGAMLGTLPRLLEEKNAALKSAGEAASRGEPPHRARGPAE